MGITDMMAASAGLSPCLTHMLRPTWLSQKTSHLPSSCVSILPQTLALTETLLLLVCCGCSVCEASAGGVDWLEKANTSEDQIFKLKGLALIKLSGEMSAVI